MFYFYCPHCKTEREEERLPMDIVTNIRDGYGVPIYHHRCCECGNLDAGYMRGRSGSDKEKAYYRSTISLYQNIRGFG